MAETPVVIKSRRGNSEADFKLDGRSVKGSFRQHAWKVFEQTPMPTLKDEAWRRTDLRGLHPEAYRLAQPEEYLRLPDPPITLQKSLTGMKHGGQVILLPGGVKSTLDPTLAEQGVIFTDLMTAEEKYPYILEKVMGQVVRPEEGRFAALAGALSQTGVLLYVPRGVQVNQPLHSLLWGAGAGIAHLSHLMVYLEEGSQVTYVHEAASPEEEGQVMHAGVVEIHVGEGAKLHWVELQSWAQNAWNFSHERARVQRDGQLDWIFGAVGSKVTKNFSTLDLAGTGSIGKMSGFYFTNLRQHLDHDTQQNHLAPHTTSDLIFKGALQGESRSVWQGMIYVAPGAVKTDGYQANRNLVLSPMARADSIPGLEILADDVRCTHGATVGRIDEEQVFYLLSRGIPRQEAERLIVEGFFDPIMERIPFEGVRERFQEAIHHKMDSNV